MEKMTYHCEVVRQERIRNIINKIGMGQVIKEKYIHTIEQMQKGIPGTFTCITDTGITIIKSEDKQKIITIYVTSYRELVAIFNGAKNIPTYLRKKVDHNQSLFIKEGKTIWK